MAYDVRQYPKSVYPSEVQSECPEAETQIDVLIGKLKEFGPSPPGYSVKNLGKQKANIWQINLRAGKRQVRILYGVYGNKIIIFRIHKKSSPPEQKRAYELAVKRKKEYEKASNRKEVEDGGSFKLN